MGLGRIAAGIGGFVGGVGIAVLGISLGDTPEGWVIYLLGLVIGGLTAVGMVRSKC